MSGAITSTVFDHTPIRDVGGKRERSGSQSIPSMVEKLFLEVLSSPFSNFSVEEVLQPFMTYLNLSKTALFPYDVITVIRDEVRLVDLFGVYAFNVVLVSCFDYELSKDTVEGDDLKRLNAHINHTAAVRERLALSEDALAQKDVVIAQQGEANTRLQQELVSVTVSSELRSYMRGERSVFATAIADASTEVRFGPVLERDGSDGRKYPGPEFSQRTRQACDSSGQAFAVPHGLLH